MRNGATCAAPPLPLVNKGEGAGCTRKIRGQRTCPGVGFSLLLANNRRKPRVPQQEGGRKLPPKAFAASLCICLKGRTSQTQGRPRWRWPAARNGSCASCLRQKHVRTADTGDNSKEGDRKKSNGRKLVTTERASEAKGKTEGNGRMSKGAKATATS